LVLIQPALRKRQRLAQRLDHRGNQEIAAELTRFTSVGILAEAEKFSVLWPRKRHATSTASGCAGDHDEQHSRAGRRAGKDRSRKNAGHSRVPRSQPFRERLADGARGNVDSPLARLLITPASPKTTPSTALSSDSIVITASPRQASAPERRSARPRSTSA